MQLPDSVKAFGEQIEQGGDIAAPPELFEAYDVFAAEVAQIFTRPWMALDHASRLAEDGAFFRADVGPRSIVVVREKEGRIHALRNACLHAGYRVCEEESGRAEQLFCQYHGWYYALDGRLTDPNLRPDIADRSRYRLPRYAMQIARGLVFVDPSKVGPEAPPAEPFDLGAMPDLAERAVSRRERYKATVNWKPLREFLWQAPDLAFGGGGVDAVVEFGPLSLIAVKGDDAALIRIVPRFPGHTDVELIEMPKTNGAARAERPVELRGDPLGEALREQGDSLAAAPLSRDFCGWYWPQMAPLAAPAEAPAAG